MPASLAVTIFLLSLLCTPFVLHIFNRKPGNRLYTSPCRLSTSKLILGFFNIGRRIFSLFTFF